ncbi:MAG: oxidoreductase domain-containing protein [Candidatus Saganbacteria bacterium]|uniref:Oxidoreductase domain-containing protein n=1 Tax=Candidatus Saganbacteria bacterium TaxID=2575572 RepID=A0A833L2E1_UNCSA|nr:MAG: oxidoreductase domain-containing protein [Candidatus Saganbacteria bacterium]
MRFVVIGFGSIGKRHTNNLLAVGSQVVLLRHGASPEKNEMGLPEYYSFDELFTNEKTIDGAIICSPTAFHQHDVAELIERSIPFLLEKPPTQDLPATQQLMCLLDKNQFTKYDIAFNMRYFPVLRFIKDFLPQLGKMYSAKIWAAHYLPYWRKNVDYRQSSSANKELGGGVHLEMIHEIDYLIWFFGLPIKVFGYVNRISDLEISTNDICSAILEYESGAVVELHLDYLSQKRLRGCQIIAENGTLEWSIEDNQVNLFGKTDGLTKIVFSLPVNYDFNNTYQLELKNFMEIIEGKSNSRVDIKTALNSMRVVEAIKQSSRTGRLIKLDAI